jgi:hypothetical protein
MRRGQQRDPVLDNNEEIDENFWASAAANRAAGDQELDQGTYLYFTDGAWLTSRWRCANTIRNTILP